jgi:hypothetical protein
LPKNRYAKGRNVPSVAAEDLRRTPATVVAFILRCLMPERTTPLNIYASDVTASPEIHLTIESAVLRHSPVFNKVR